MKTDYKALQNGSDIRGVAISGVNGEPVNLDETVAEQLGKAFFYWCRGKHPGDITIAVGKDSRMSGSELKQAFSKGVQCMGGNVIDCGIASTPAMFMATKSEKVKATAGVMLTASHLPYNRNGLKFFTDEGGLDKKDISEILDLAAGTRFDHSGKRGTIRIMDFISVYSKGLVKYIRNSVNHPDHFKKPLRGLKIIVDAGNGAGGFFAEKILHKLGADITGSQFLDPDGMFPNHIPNPEDKAAMDAICSAVTQEKADLGIIFDTDVDRAAIVDSQGNPINRNALIALISAIVLEEHPESAVVTDSITSTGLNTFIEDQLKGKHHRFKRGYKNVINEAIRLNKEGVESWIAIETSGHAALKENYFLDDGAFLVAKILVKVAQMHMKGETISDLIEPLQHPLESEEVRFSIKEKDFAKYGQEVIERLTEIVKSEEGWEAEKENYEGIRVNCKGENEKGWFLLRLSLHDPVMPLNVESDIQGGVNTIMNRLKVILKEFRGLDAK
ncbi:MAG TPA: hypothetical protein VJ951_03445 [Bacteroidales bacterium]|nr:hypothetical protein [Bacteroidales bacterium]